MIGDIIVTNILASACLVLLVYFFDVNEKEPPWTLVKVYICAILLTFIFGKLKQFSGHIDIFDAFKSAEKPNIAPVKIIVGVVNIDQVAAHD